MIPENDKLKETTLSTEPIFDGKIISVQVDRVRLPNGETASREIVKHPGAVAVLAPLQGKLLVVEQFRAPLRRNLVEIPAGKLDKGEAPEAAAARELKEETGFTAGRMTLLHSFYTAPGFCDELIYLYFAEDLQAGDRQPDEDEFVECFAITADEAQAMIREGRIGDAKTLLAVYIWQNLKAAGR